MPDPRIRPAWLLDIRQIYRLEQQIFPRDAYPYFDLSLLFLIPGMVNLKVVDEDGDLAGFVCGAKAWTPAKPAWIITLGVNPGFQRQGIGRALLSACEDRLHNKRVRLTVREGNHPAICLYESTGYTTLEVARGYYRDGENGIIMEKKMPRPAYSSIR